MNLLKQRTIISNLIQAAKEADGWDEIVTQGEELLAFLSKVDNTNIIHRDVGDLTDTPDEDIANAARELYKSGNHAGAATIIKRFTTMNPTQDINYCDLQFKD